MKNLQSFNDTILQKTKTKVFNATELQILVCKKISNYAKKHFVPAFFKSHNQQLLVADIFARGLRLIVRA